MGVRSRDLLQKLRELNGARPDDWTEEDVDSLIRAVRDSQHALGLDALSGIRRLDLAKRVCEVIYRESDDTEQAEAMIEKIRSELVASHQ